jgi:hypothetical protein
VPWLGSVAVYGLFPYSLRTLFDRSMIAMKHEYHEGKKALERFERGMSKLFKASKDSVRAKPIPKLKKSVRETKGNASKG